MQFVPQSGLRAPRAEVPPSRLRGVGTTPAPHAILDAMADAVFVADGARRIAYLNRAARRVSGWSSADAVGRPLSELVLADDAGDRPGCRACQIVTPLGERLPTEASYSRLDDGTGTVVVCRDIGPALALSAALSHRAEHDPLTGLPNRNRLLSRLRAAVLDAATRQQPVVVGFLDIDGMKRVNDTLGHAAGDELLVAVARRLSASVRDDDTVARLGGDEFVVVLNRVAHAAAGEAVMRALHGTLTAPYQVAGACVRIGVSAGLALCPDHGVTAAQLLARADRAMYVAKQARSAVALASV